MCEKGDLLFTLDCRQIEADMKRVQAIIDGAQATLEQAQRDVERYTDLAARNATPIVTLNNAQTAVNVSRATAESNRAQLENLKVQLSFCAIRAPISGRISMANVKVGNFVRQADTSPMATINQMVPVYVTFTVPQKISSRHPQGHRRRDRDCGGDHSGRAKARQRPGHHDREHRRSGDRHGDGARDHAEQGRTALARHSGHH